ncbi:MAG TPA: metalloregulator ArsR/SmtB family transcription factor [Acidimicrobiales bacterium]
MLNQSATLDPVFRALGDPTRRLMVERLSTGPASVSELAAPLQMSLPAVLQHLSVLESCGLVRSKKVGRTRTCRLDSSAMRSAESWFASQRALWEQRFDRLAEVLAEDEQGT